MLKPLIHALSCSLVAVVGLQCACGDDVQDPLGDYTRKEGSGCGFAAPECEEEALWKCREQRWERFDCSEVCAARGGSRGCAVVDHGVDPRCECEDPPECMEGEERCTSEGVLGVCDPDTLQFVDHSCDDLCAALDPPHRSQGCSHRIDLDYTCGCTTVGTPCTAQDGPRCEIFGLYACVGGIWVMEPCQCDPWGPAGPACSDG